MSDQLTDESLMLAYQKGDATAFDELYRRYRGSLYRYFLRQCYRAAVAEELFQDVWMKLIKARENYQVRAKFSTYLFHLAHNHLIDFYRKQSGHMPLSYGEDSDAQKLAGNECDGPESRASANEKVSKFLALLEQLPEAQREALMLREEGGLSIEEIAQATNVNAETAKSRLRYAVNKLRKAMQEETG
ncbi:MAG: sigma-70 family RNA polymerase sigma factor [Acidiferrobacterales bacterium]